MLTNDYIVDQKNRNRYKHRSHVPSHHSSSRNPLHHTVITCPIRNAVSTIAITKLLGTANVSTGIVVITLPWLKVRDSTVFIYAQPARTDMPIAMLPKDRIVQQRPLTLDSVMLAGQVYEDDDRQNDEDGC